MLLRLFYPLRNSQSDKNRFKAVLVFFPMKKIQFCKRTDLCHLDDYVEYVTIEVGNKSLNMDIKLKVKLFIGITSKATSFTNV